MADATTARAQRLQAVEEGSADTAVDRVSPPANPTLSVPKTHLQNGGLTDERES